jgi:hypothetical protein
MIPADSFHFFGESDTIRRKLNYPIFHDDEDVYELNLLPHWVGDEFACIGNKFDWTNDAIAAAVLFGRYAVQRLRPIERVRCIAGWRFPGDLLCQEIYSAAHEPIETDPRRIRDRLLVDCNNVSADELLTLVRSNVVRVDYEWRTSQLKVFADAEKQYLGLGELAYNLLHDVIRTYVLCRVLPQIHPIRNEMTASEMGELSDSLAEVWDLFQDLASIETGKTAAKFKSLVGMLNDKGITSLPLPDGPYIEQFVPGSVVVFNKKRALISAEQDGGSPPLAFGKVLGNP